MLAILLISGQIACEKPPNRRASRHDKRVEALKKALKSDNLEESVKSAVKLSNMGPKAINAAGTLVEVMGGENAKLRAYAAFALGKICKSTGNSTSEIRDAVIPALRKTLEDPDDLVRAWSVLALFRVDPEADPAIEVISDLLEQKGDTDMRIQAAGVVVQMGPRGKGAVPALIKALGSPPVSRHAAYALGAIGPDAKDAIKALTRVVGMGGAAGDAAEVAIEQIRK